MALKFKTSTTIKKQSLSQQLHVSRSKVLNVCSCALPNLE